MPSKVVILEGSDGSGKTYLANWLHMKHDYEIVKTGPPKPDEDVTASYLNALHTALDKFGRTVFDRLHLGECVYGPLLRGVDRTGIEGLRAIETAIAFTDTRLIICSPPWKTVLEGWRSKDDLLKSPSQLYLVYGRYLEEAARLGIMPYDWTAVDAEEKLMEMIEG